MSTGGNGARNPLDVTASVLFYGSLLTSIPYSIIMQLLARVPRVGSLPTFRAMELCIYAFTGLQVILTVSAVFLARGTTLTRCLAACACIALSVAGSFFIAPLRRALGFGPPTPGGSLTLGAQIGEAAVSGLIYLVLAVLLLSSWMIVRRRRWWGFAIVALGMLALIAVDRIVSMYPVWSQLGLSPRFFYGLRSALTLVTPLWKVGLLLFVAALDRRAARAPGRPPGTAPPYPRAAFPGSYVP